MSLFDDASLVLIPDGAKDSKLYSVKPTDGGGDFTFSRGSNLAATRVNENGLIEKGRENLLLYSEEFDNADWTKVRSSVTANSELAPDGTTTADEIECTTSSIGGFNVNQTAISVTGTTSTATCFIKKGSTDFAMMSLNLSIDGVNQWFNINTGEVLSSANTGTGWSKTDASISLISDGWYKITLSVSKPSGSNVRVNIYPSVDGDGTLNVTIGDVGFIWGAQLEVGSVATEYIQSTSTTGKAGVLEDLPRIDYSEGGCPSLLLEPQRTNLATYSEDFDNASWTKTRSAIISDSISSPDGTLTADKLNAETDVLDNYVVKSFSVSSGTSYILSVFAKSAEYQYLVLRASTPSYDQVFNLSTGTLGNSNGTGSATIEDYGDGWYRCSIIFTTTTTTLNNLIKVSSADVADGTSSTTAGNGIYIWGAQLEEGSYPTSYIPTNSAAVTRNADSCILTGVSSLIGQTEGTILFKTDFSESTVIHVLGQNLTVTDEQVKIEYSSTEIKFYLNDSLIATKNGTFDFSGTDEIELGNYLGGSQLGGHISNFITV